MEVREVTIDEVIPYENNPRLNDEAVEKVANSIKAFGFQQPIVVDKNNVIIVGHTRLKAAKSLKLKTVPVVVADELSDEKVKAYRLADNKVSEFAEWDDEKLLQELDGILDLTMSDFGFEDDFVKEIEEEVTENPYTTKTAIPQYEIQGVKPDISQLVDGEKTQELLDEIEQSDINDDIKNFLRAGAMRHLKFNYANIAEYYAHASKEVQELFERSALVIIDYEEACANGYATFSSVIDEIKDGESDE